MKKVICIIESLGSGGAERQLVGLASLLKVKGLDVEVWTYYPDDFYKYVLDENNVTYRYIKEAQSGKKRFSVIKKKLKREKPDCVISYSATISTLLCFMKMLGASFKLIVSERNTTQKLDFRERLRFFSYRFANVIVPNSYTQGDFFKRFYKNLFDKVSVITNFVDTDIFIPLEKKVVNKKKQILIVGRMMEQKNIPTFLKVVEELKKDRDDFHIDWYGRDNGNEYSKSCHSLVESLNIGNVFKFHEATTNIREMYQRCNIFCLPSLYEGFPNVVCEAMSCGCPIVCSDVCDNCFLVDEKNGVLFNPLSIKSMKEGLNKILDLPNKELYQMGKQSRCKAVNMFSRDRFIESYLKLI